MALLPLPLADRFDVRRGVRVDGRRDRDAPAEVAFRVDLEPT